MANAAIKTHFRMMIGTLNGEPVITTSNGPVYLRGGKIVPAPPQWVSSRWFLKRRR